MLLPALRQRLSATPTRRVEVRPLAAAHGTVPTSIAQTHEVERRAVERTAIVPDSDVIWALLDASVKPHRLSTLEMKK